jgi:hypothetical protein
VKPGAKGLAAGPQPRGLTRRRLTPRRRNTADRGSTACGRALAARENSGVEQR